VSLQVKKPFTSDLQQSLHADDCGDVVVVRAEMIQHRDDLFALNGRLNAHVAAVHGVVTEPDVN